MSLITTGAGFPMSTFSLLQTNRTMLAFTGAFGPAAEVVRLLGKFHVLVPAEKFRQQDFAGESGGHETI